MPEAASAGPRHAPLVLIVAAVLAFAAMRAPLLPVPLERDEGEYAYIAQRMLAGEVPYRDAFDQKPPGVFAAYLLAFAVAGPTVQGIHLFLALWTAVTAAALYALVRRLAGGLAAGFALLVFALASSDPSVQGHAANTENWMLLPLVLAAHACLRGWERGDRISWLACGALAACACWFKQVAATDACLFAAAAFGDAVIGRPSPGARKALARLALFALGGGLASAPVLLGFAAAGAWDPFLDAVFLHNLAYTQSASAREGIGNLLGSLIRQLPSFWPVWVLANLGWLLPGSVSRRVRHALAAWWLASFAGATIGLQFRPHYFLQTLPALAALAGIGAAGLAERLARRGIAGRRLPAAIAAGLLLVPLAVHRDLLRADSPAEISRRIYGLNPFPEAAVFADEIRRSSLPDDRVFIVGSEPQILFLAGRRSATRYIFFYPLTGDYPDARERQQEVIDEVKAARPLYIVWVDVVTSLLRTPRSQPLVFDATLELIAREYQLEMIAHVDPASASYRTLRGEPARRWAREAIATQREALPLVALYRRAGV
jgi:4-amino-4-deoxy-L-arabinose transferase-like glycosyltransferase